jgi:hypothetical protein
MRGAASGPTYPLDGLSPSGAWSVSRDLLTAYIGGSRYTDSSGISPLNDQSGNARNLTAGAGVKPALATAGPNSRACADFDGTNDVLTGAALSTFISNTTGYMVVSFIADAISANDAAAYYNNHGVMGTLYAGLYLRDTTGSPDTLVAANYDANPGDVANRADIVIGTACVAEWRHEGGNLYCRVNGGTEASVASGDTQSLADAFNLGLGYTTYANIKVFEAAIFATVPGSNDRDTIVADMMDWIGV